jgi:hypothetical protein
MRERGMGAETDFGFLKRVIQNGIKSWIQAAKVDPFALKD